MLQEGSFSEELSSPEKVWVHIPVTIFPDLYLEGAGGGGVEDGRDGAR